MHRGKLFVVSAPSGCGKGTILREILTDQKFYFSVSATTRQPREGEQDGVQYRFMEKEDFERSIEKDEFLEYAQYCGNYYGTLAAPVTRERDLGKHVILEIEVKGASQIRQKCPDAVMIFIAPPSLEVLRERLHKRGTEPPEVIEERVAQAGRELSCREAYDYCIVNDVLEEAVEDFRAVVRAEELKIEKVE